MEKLSTQLTKPVSLCDCTYECPAHPRDRLLHFDGKCFHVDGTYHKIYNKDVKRL